MLVYLVMVVLVCLAVLPLEIFIRHQGTPNALFSNNAKIQFGNTVCSTLRM